MIDIVKGLFKKEIAIGNISVVTLIILNMIELHTNKVFIEVKVVTLIILFASLYLIIKNHLVVSKNNEVSKSAVEFSKFILNVDSREQLFDEILNEVVKRIPGAQKGSIISVSEGKLNFEAVVGFDIDSVRGINLRLEDTVLFRQTSGSMNSTVHISDIMLYNKGQIDEKSYVNMSKTSISEIKATITSPILLNGTFIGMINVDSTSHKGFKKQDIELVEQYSRAISSVIGLYHVFEKNLESAKYDHLTNALNRGFFMDSVDKMLTEYQADNTVICYIDLDKLKVVNDKYGHNVGDRYLVKLVEGLGEHLREGELVSRFGGDEFVVLLHRNEEEVLLFHNECRNWFNLNKVIIGYDVIEASYSYGISKYPSEAKTLNELIKLADSRMYEDKLKRRRK